VILKTEKRKTESSMVFVDKWQYIPKRINLYSGSERGYYTPNLSYMIPKIPLPALFI
jgi:hypothetical protein